MIDNKPSWYVKSEEGKVYGPATVESLVTWAKDGRIQPTGFLSQNRIDWQPSYLMPELEMKWFVEPEPGKAFGPFNREFVDHLLADGSAGPDAKVYCQPEEADEPEEPVEKVVEKVVEKIVEVPVEKIVEKVVEKVVEVPVEKVVEKVVTVPVEKVIEKFVEVPVEKIVEKIVEKEVRVEVPVEKIVEKVVEVPVEKIVEKIVEVPVEKIVEKVVEKEVRVEVPVEKIVEKIVEVPVEKIVEKVVEVEVSRPVVIPEVVEPVPVAPIDSTPPPPPSPGAIFKGMNRSSLAALEAAARRELAKGRRFGKVGEIFGRKK